MFCKKCYVIPCLLLFSLAYTSCSGRDGQDAFLTPSGAPDGSLDAAAVIPRPSDFGRQVSEVDLESIHVYDGAQALAMIPAHNADISPEPGQPFQWNAGGNLRFSPTSQAGNGGLSSASYAFYPFGQLDAEESLDIHLDWVAPPQPGCCFIGIASFAEDRWFWLPADSPTVHIADLSPYKKPYAPYYQGIYLIVMLQGDQPRDLDCIFVGDSPEPQPVLLSDLSPTPADNLAPRQVSFELDADLAGAEFEDADFDLDGLPGYEVLGSADGQADQLYTQPGEYLVKARLHDDLGRTSECELAFTIVDPLNQNPSAEFTLNYTEGLAPLKLHLDASPSSDGDGQITRYQWDIDDDGRIDFDSGSEPELDYAFGQNGTGSVRLWVTDNYFAMDSVAYSINVIDGWHRVPIASNIALADLDMAQVGYNLQARASVVYQVLDGTTTSLYSATASSLSGDSWGAPVLLDSADATQRTGLNPSLCQLPGGGLGLAFGRQDNGSGIDSLCFQRCEEDGTSWNPKLTLMAAPAAGYDNSIAVIDGQPAIASVEEISADVYSRIYYLRSDDALGTSWSAGPKLILQDPGEIWAPCLHDGPDGPLVAFTRNEYVVDDQYTEIYTSPDNLGDSWVQKDWWQLNNQISKSMLDLASGETLFLGGQPLSGGQLSCVSSISNEAGRFWESNMHSLPANDNDHGGWCDAAVINGGTAYCFSSNDTGHLRYVRSSQNAWDSLLYESPWAVQTFNVSAGPCKLTSVNDKPVIVYFDTVESTLYACWLGS